MRISIPLAALLLAACGEAQPQDNAAAPAASAAPASAMTVYAGAGRDRLCLDRRAGRAGFIAYGAGSDVNCSVRGRLTDPNTIRPDGDSSCAIRLSEDGGVIRLVGDGTACAYYCGPGASFDGARFQRDHNGPTATDLAGDPLC